MLDPAVDRVRHSIRRGFESVVGGGAVEVRELVTFADADDEYDVAVRAGLHSEVLLGPGDTSRFLSHASTSAAKMCLHKPSEALR